MVGFAFYQCKIHLLCQIIFHLYIVLGQGINLISYRPIIILKDTDKQLLCRFSITNGFRLDPIRQVDGEGDEGLVSTAAQRFILV